MNPTAFTPQERERLLRGMLVDIAGKRYVLCAACHKIVRVNKPILGSGHICSPKEQP